MQLATGLPITGHCIKVDVTDTTVVPANYRHDRRVYHTPQIHSVDTTVVYDVVYVTDTTAA